MDLGCFWQVLLLLQDCDLSDMKVDWSLLGMCLYNVSLALSTSPILHQNLTMTERCECAVAGFVLWDLWKLLADQSLGFNYYWYAWTYSISPYHTVSIL